MTERELLDAARRGDEDAFGRLVEPHRARAARPLLPDARLGRTTPRTPLQEALLRAWRGLARFEGRSSLRSWLYTIATNACLKAIERRPKRVLPIDYGPAADPHDGPGAAARRVGLGRALPGRAPGPRRRPRRARGALRAARERRARVHRRAPAPAGAPARRADPARRARLLRRARSPTRSRRRPPRSTARCSAPTRPSTSGCPSAASRPRCARSATTRCARSSTLRRRLGARRRRRARRDAHRRRHDRDAADADLVPRPRRRRRLPGALPARGRHALEHRSRSRQRPAGLRPYRWDADSGQLRRARIDVLTLDGARIAEITAFIAPGRSGASACPPRASPSCPTADAHPRPGSRQQVADDQRRVATISDALVIGQNA